MPGSNPFFHNNLLLSICLVPVLCSLSFSPPLLLSGVSYNADGRKWWKRERATRNKDQKHWIRTAFTNVPSVSRLQVWEVEYPWTFKHGKPQWLKSVTLDTCLGLLWWMQEGQGLGIPKWWAQLLFLSSPFQRSRGRVWGPARLTAGSKGHLWVSS